MTEEKTEIKIPISTEDDTRESVETPVEQQAAEENPQSGPALDEQLQQLVAENTELRDKWLRAVAEADNIRKRKAKEQQQAVQIATDNILTDFLEVIDNFDRALLAIDENANSPEFVTGIKLIYQQFHDILDRRGVKEIDAVGKPFNPSHHEALLEVESELPEHTVVNIIQKGFTIYDRVLRHARVAVAKKIENPEPTQDNQENA